MNWQSITLEELRGLGCRIDSEFVIAESLEGLYQKLNEQYSPNNWTLLRSPVWVESNLVALVIRPRTVEVEE